VGRLTQAARNLQKQKARVNPQIIWLASPSWMTFDHLAHRLKHGANWVDGQLYMKDSTTGIVIDVLAGGVTELPPRADCEAAGKRLLAERVAEYQRQLQLDVIRLRRQKAAREEQQDNPGNLMTDNPPSDPPTDPPSNPSSPTEGDEPKEPDNA
jgi:hypothetical protein